jgi:hypothetical protein
MGITAMMKRVFNQPVVYWGNPVSDGFNNFTYDPPVELLCRWEDTETLIRNKQGDDVISKAVVYLLQDVVLDGILLLGSLNDLDSDMDSDPRNIANTYLILQFDKKPALGSTTEFQRKAYL